MKRETPTPETWLQLWKAIAAAGLRPAAVAEALASGAAGALGDVGGVCYRGPDGRWVAVICGPDPSARWSGEAGGPPPSPAGAEAPWLKLAPFAGDLGACAVAPLESGGEVLGAVAVARRGGAFSPEEPSWLRQAAEAASGSLASALQHGRLTAEAEVLRGAAPWLVAYARDYPAMFFLKDEAGVYRIVNPAMAAFSRTVPEQMMGKTDEELYPPEQAGFFRAIDRQIMATGQPAITTDKFYLGGQWRVFLANKFPVKDAAGKVVGVAGSVTPIPDEKVATDALARGEEQLNFITDALPELMAYLDADESFRFCNRAYELWFGKERTQIVRRPAKEVFGDEVYALLQPQIRAVLADGGNRHFELRLPHSDGVLRNTRVSIAAQRNFIHETVGLVMLISDVTDQKLAEERLRFLGDVGGLLAARLDDAPEIGAPLKTIAALSVLKL
ncbi:MAG TPA: PAS domain-containing protein, partial [Myxococcales bacterium]|nr:PAS domain-containing protein [Myxococcales bacterium]